MFYKRRNRRKRDEKEKDRSVGKYGVNVRCVLNGQVQSTVIILSSDILVYIRPKKVWQQKPQSTCRKITITHRSQLNILIFIMIARYTMPACSSKPSASDARLLYKINSAFRPSWDGICLMNCMYCNLSTSSMAARETSAVSSCWAWMAIAARQAQTTSS